MKWEHDIQTELERLRRKDVIDTITDTTARHTQNPNTRRYKGRPESRDHREARQGRKWDGDEHGAYKRCLIGPHFAKWGANNPFNVCPDHLPMVLQYGEMVVKALINFAGSAQGAE